MSGGQKDAWGDLLPVVYNEVRQLAAAKMARESPGQTLQATALVNEAYVRMVSGEKQASWENRRRFFAAEAMRRVLVDSARRRLAEKRGGGRRPSSEIDRIAAPETSDDVLALHDALDRLADRRPDVAELVKLRYFAGLTGKQAAECPQISPRTADNYWAYARAFLFKEIESASG